MRLLKKLLPDRERALGTYHPGTLDTREGIAFWTGETGRPGEALQLFNDLKNNQQVPANLLSGTKVG